MQENIMLLIKATLQQRMHGTGQFVFWFSLSFYLACLDAKWQRF